jgi:L-alanine-DL-glutamate epimerase-like enolase superfamily enzyme
MRFEKIDTYVLKYPEPNDFSSDRYTLIVKIEAKDGAVGWGEGIAMWPEACKASELIVREGLFPVIKDYSPLDVEKCWHAMREHIWWYGYKNAGIANFALSAIDIALWDLKAKNTGQPLVKLLGGKITERLPANASIHVNQPTIAESIRDIENYIDQGFQSVKLGFGKKGPSKVGKVSPDYDVDFIRQVRLALGDEPDIMVDIGNGVQWEVPTAVKTTKRMEEYNIRWIEEPLYPTDIKGYQALRSQTHTMIGGGEREWSYESYKRLLQYDCIDVFGIDPGRVQGITGYKKIQDVVSASHRYVNAHAWSTAITTAASLHCSLASNNCLVFELKPIPGPVQFDLVEKPIIQEDGWVSLDDGPGLGIKVVEKELQELTLLHNCVDC